MRVRVVVRVRPLLEHEVARGTTSTCLHVQSQNVSLSAARGARASFNVDGAFGPETSQDGFFEACGIQPLVSAVLDGFHGTVFAYGQTGSGKTFTMEGYVYAPAKPGHPPHVDVAATEAGDVQRRAAVLIRLVDISAVLQQHTRRVDVAFIAGDEQRRCTVIPHIVDIRSVVQQLLYYFNFIMSTC